MLYTWNLLIYNTVHQLWKVKVKVTSDSSWPHDIACGIFQARMLKWVAFPFSRGIFPIRGLSPGLPHCRQILYQLSHTGSPRILEWISLLQQIFPTQESNWGLRGLLHCRQILYWAIWETLYLSLKKKHLSTRRKNSHLWESSKANPPAGKNLNQEIPPYAFHCPSSLMHKKRQFLLYSQYFPVTFKELTVIELQRINDGRLNF